MDSERRRKLDERIAEANRRKDAVRNAYRTEVGTDPPDEVREADREALRILSNAWGSREDAIREAMARGQSWTGLAMAALTDFPPAITPETRVHVSGAGNAYHRFRDCPALVTGKEKALDEGKTLHVIAGMKLSEAEERKGFKGLPLRSCRTCIPRPSP